MPTKKNLSLPPAPHRPDDPLIFSSETADEDEDENDEDNEDDDDVDGHFFE